MTELRLRAKVAAGRHTRTLVGVLVVLALVGGWGTYTAYATPPPTTTEERVASSWSTTGSFTHVATVTTPNSLFPVGEELPNRPVYFQRLSPVLEGTYDYRLDASEGGTLSGTVSTVLVVRSVEERTSGTIELWQYNRSLGDHPIRVTAGESVRVPFVIDVAALTDETRRIDEELGGTLGRTNVTLVTVVDVAGTVNGDPVAHREEYALPVALERNTYRVQQPAPVTRERETVEAVTVTVPPSPLYRVGGPVLCVLALGGVVGLTVARRRGALVTTDADRAYLAYRAERATFDEWISPISLPADVLARPRARAASLEALVDFAIDTNNAVVEDPEDRTYYVVHGESLYEYVPPARPAGDDALSDPAVDAAHGATDAEAEERATSQRDDGRTEGGTPGDD